MPLNPHVKGGSDVPVPDGGTGASTGSAGLANLGGLDTAAHNVLDHTGLTGVGDLTTAAHGSLNHAGISGVGKVIQQVRSEFRSSVAVASGTPYDNTIPQWTEGQLLMQVSITPQSLSNVLVIDFVSWGEMGGTPSIIIFHLHRDSATNAIAASSRIWNGAPGSSGGMFSLRHFLNVPTLASQTYQLRVGSGSGTQNINGVPYLGAARQTTLICTEYAP